MILSTTGSLEGYTVREYYSIVFGEVVLGVNFIKDFAAGLSDLFGGRSETYEDEIIKGRGAALDEMARRAGGMGANAVLSIKVDYEVLGSSNGMIMITAAGTAVRVEKN